MDKMILQLHTHFNSIDLKYYGLFMESKDDLLKLSEGKRYWDILSHTQDENNKYYLLNSQIQEYGYISLIFRHISIEGFINDIAVRYIGENEFYSGIEQMSFIDKIEKVYELISKKKFPRGEKLFSNLKDLNSVRNTLVHMKSGVLSFDDIYDLTNNGEAKFFSLINKMTGNKRNKISAQKDYVQVVEETNTLYDDLSALFYEQVKNNIQ